MQVLPFFARPSFWPAMARERASADDAISLLEDLTVGDLDKIVVAAERQRETKRESGKRS